jgi:uncharacterized protein YjbI with pentapeptide repeats
MADFDAFNIEALEKSVNDSASRVSAIWITFLTFSLYLLIAATTVTHRQLLLAEPLKLPILNVELPLWGFFFLAPILFVILHFYVLLQILLLGRTTAAYDIAVERASLSPEANASLRQRLANTLFAQIFAGSPREREGFIGWLLRATVWTTLVIAPILILLAFQFMFLPYHSHCATWTHRLLIFGELMAAFWLWPIVLDARRDFNWPKLKFRFNRSVTMPKRKTIQKEFRRLYRQPFPAVIFLLYVFFSFWLAAFPGEPHANLLNGQPPKSVQCARWLSNKFDHLDLTWVSFVDGKELPRIEKDIGDHGILTYLGERTRNLRDRNLNCAIFAYADLRYADFSNARLAGARFDGANLQGTMFENSRFAGASLNDAKLQGSSLRGAELQGASLKSAYLQGAFFFNTKLQGTVLDAAQLQGASLENTQLQGASLIGTQLQGAELAGTHLEGALLYGAQLQGADLSTAHFDGASLSAASLQGADLLGGSLNSAIMSGVKVWRTQNAQCVEGYVSGYRFNNDVAGFSFLSFNSPLPSATANDIENFIDAAVGDIRDARIRRQTYRRMNQALVSKLGDDDLHKMEDNWNQCEEKSKAVNATFHELRAKLLLKLICEGDRYGQNIAEGVVRNWLNPNSVYSLPLSNSAPAFAIADVHLNQEFAAYFSKTLVAEVNAGCNVARNLEESLRGQIRDAAAKSSSAH